MGVVKMMGLNKRTRWPEARCCEVSSTCSAIGTCVLVLCVRVCVCELLLEACMLHFKEFTSSLEAPDGVDDFTVTRCFLLLSCSPVEPVDVNVHTLPPSLPPSLPLSLALPPSLSPWPSLQMLKVKTLTFFLLTSADWRKTQKHSWHRRPLKLPRLPPRAWAVPVRLLVMLP